MKIDPNKKYRTRDGREVIIHAINGPREGFPVVASIRDELANGGWQSRDFAEDGSFYHPPMGNSNFDLMEVREPREWKAVVCIKDGVLPSGHLAHYDEGDELDPNYEIVRVREIID